MTRGEGHTRSSKKSSGKEKGSEQPREGTPTTSRDGQSNSSGAAAEDDEGGSSRKLTRNQFKALMNKAKYHPVLVFVVLLRLLIFVLTCIVSGSN